MSRKIKTLLSRVLLSTFIFLLVTPAFAMYTYEENALPTLTEEKYNIVLYVTESCALLLDEQSQQTHNTDPSGVSITLPVTVRNTDGLTQTTIDLTNTSCLKNVVLVTGPNPQISISFPWGVSVSGIGSQGISCKTTLTAVLYKRG